MTKQISDERLRNTRVWAAARPDMSGSEVIVGAIDELLERRAADEPKAKLMDCPLCGAVWRDDKGTGIVNCGRLNCPQRTI